MTIRNLNILFLGGGSIGAIYAHLLSQHHCTITIAVRSTFPTVSKSGYKITSTRFGNSVYRPHRVIASPADLDSNEIFNYIFVTTKATTGELPLKGYPVSAATTIILVQNGIGIEHPYAAAYPHTPILSGVAYIIASQPSPGEILQTGDTMSLLLGHYPSSPPGGEHTDLISRLNAANLPTQMVHNIQHSRWTKLLINGCYATVCAATGLSTLAVAEAPGGMELLLALGHEIRETAAAADGCEMSVQEVEGFFREKMRGLDMVPSMLQDARRGVGMEVEALCGNIVRIAERCGVQTPRLRTMYTILSGMNGRFRMERKGVL